MILFFSQQPNSSSRWFDFFFNQLFFHIIALILLDYVMLFTLETFNQGLGCSRVMSDCYMNGFSNFAVIYFSFSLFCGGDEL